MWRRIFAKIVLKFTGPEATMAFQDDQMCSGLKSGIDGAIHRVQDLWEEKSSTEEWFFSLLTQRTCSTRLIDSELSGRSDTYGRPELIFSSTAIVAGYRSFCGTGMGRLVFYIVDKV